MAGAAPVDACGAVAVSEDSLAQICAPFPAFPRRPGSAASVAEWLVWVGEPAAAGATDAAAIAAVAAITIAARQRPRGRALLPYSAPAARCALSDRDSLIIMIVFPARLQTIRTFHMEPHNIATPTTATCDGRSSGAWHSRQCWRAGVGWNGAQTSGAAGCRVWWEVMSAGSMCPRRRVRRGACCCRCGAARGFVWAVSRLGSVGDRRGRVRFTERLFCEGNHHGEGSAGAESGAATGLIRFTKRRRRGFGVDGGVGRVVSRAGGGGGALR